MIGQNTIQFNSAQICKALESYLREHEFKNPNFEVTEVKAEKDHFLITLKETDGKKPDEITNQRG